jgi:hypothetical protein
MLKESKKRMPLPSGLGKVLEKTKSAKEDFFEYFVIFEFNYR